MRTLDVADPKLMKSAIRREIARSDESRYDHRLHGLLLIIEGFSCQRVAELFGEDRRTVQRWARRFELQGLPGLREGRRGGRPASLDAAQRLALEQDLRRSPQEFGHAAYLWDAKVLAEHLRLLYGNPLSVRQCQRIFRQISLRQSKAA